MRSGRELGETDCALADPLLTAYAQMIDLFWTFKREEDGATVAQRLAAIRDARLRVAAAEFLQRTHSQDH